MATTTTEANKELVTEYLDAWMDNEPEKIPDLFDPEFSNTYVDATGEEKTVDVDVIQGMLETYAANLSEMDHQIHELVAEDDVVMARITFSGVHDGELMGIDPTGHRISVDEFFTFRFEAGQISEMRWSTDQIDMLTQMGVDAPLAD